MYADIIQFHGKFFDLGYDKVYSVKILKDAKKIDTKELNIVECNEFNVKQVLDNKNVDIIIPFETVPKDNLHYRRTVLNHVMCKLAKKNNIAVAFSLSHLFQSNNKALTLGRMQQTVKLCRKYGVKMVVASFATDSFGMRYYDNMLAMARSLFGMTPGEAKMALSTAIDIYDTKKTLHLAKGVKLVENG